MPAPDLTLRLAALTHDIGKPKTRRFEPGGKVSFHHHDAVGAKMTRKRLKALRFDHHLVEDVSELVNLHLRFHGYVEEPWTDSAVRRYVKDAGPLYERLNRLTRAARPLKNRRKRWCSRPPWTRWSSVCAISRRKRTSTPSGRISTAMRS